MEAHKKLFLHFIAQPDTTFVIPVYQRNYDWKEENCKRLFSDILMIADSGDTHFVGTVCDKMDGKYKSIIIDGQQRITTVMLLLKALYNTSADARFKRKLKNQYLTNEYLDNDLKLKLKPIKKDEAVYVKLITTENIDEDTFSTTEKRSNIYKNFKLFEELIQDCDKDENELLSATENLEIIELVLDKENPQIVFESLNSTGLDLTKTDLIRNYILMSLDYKIQEEFYNNYWLPAEEFVGSDNMEEFMLHFLVLRRKSNTLTINGKKATLGPKYLYHLFKTDLHSLNGDVEETKVFLKELLKYAKIYNKFSFDNKTPTTDIDKKLYEIYEIIDKNISKVVLMYVYNLFNEGKISADTLFKCVDLTLCFEFRSIICRHTGCNLQFAASVLQRLSDFNSEDEFYQMYAKALNSGRANYSFPKDNEFKRELMSRDIYSLHSKLCKYLLHSIERKLSGKEVLSFETGTIEHIMPQKLNDKWKEYLNKNTDLMNHLVYLHTLGNLTLTGYNSELSNKFIDEKRDFYKDSNYNITKNICTYTEWTSKQIEKRSEQLAEIALKVWEIPSIISKEIVIDTDTAYGYDCDETQFTSTKPQSVSIMGEEKECSSWYMFVCNSFKILYDIDDEILFKLQESNIFTKRQFDLVNDETNFCLNEKTGTYLQIANYSASDSISLVKKAIDFYDKIAETNLKDEFYFVLSKV